MNKRQRKKAKVRLWRIRFEISKRREINKAVKQIAKYVDDAIAAEMVKKFTPRPFVHRMKSGRNYTFSETT